MFLERVVVLVSACICLCSTAFASIVVDVNNLDDTVRYRSYKKITKWNSVDEKKRGSAIVSSLLLFREICCIFGN